MTRITPVLALVLALVLPQAARAQLTPAQLATHQVAALAPQLALLAGSPANLQALAAGLVLGQPIVLTATTPDGITQIVTLAPPAGTSANLQALMGGLTAGAPITLAGSTPAGAPTTLTFRVPGGPMSQFEAAQALGFAGQLLASQGIVNPSAEQVRAALLGGAVRTPAGTIAMRGVLEGRGTAQTAISTFGTSFGPTVSTSASPVFGTSFSPTLNPVQPGATGAAGPNGPPSIAAQMQGRR